MRPPSILILAAGEGTRMKSSLPKVLHQAAGDTLLGHVSRAASVLKGPLGVVVGHGADQVKARFPSGHKFFLQKKRLGSGHAVMSAAGWLKKQGGDVVVLCGDAPMIRPETLKALVGLHRREKNAATLLTARVANPFGYGRILRDRDNRPVAIVEHKDATDEERAVSEINSGSYCFSARALLGALKRIRPNNAKGEYYITDVIGLLVKDGQPVGAYCLPHEEEVLGVNRRAELAQAEKILRRRFLERLMDEGVTVLDPDATYVDAGVRVGPDSVIHPQTFLKGSTRVGRGADIGPFTVLVDCQVADGAQITASFGENAVVGPGAKVGPFARLRPGARLARDVRVGNFSEVKKSRLGPGAKVNHLSYIGDAVVGAAANIGAGTITCNYDGFHKYVSRIGAKAFIGSNTNLVAPVSVGAGAVTGAGSTITKNVPAGALGLERAAQVVRRGWAARRRAAGK